MNTCACCGQNVKTDGRLIVKVDDALLSLCNEAYANAQARASGEVLIADLAWCLARSARWAADVTATGLSPAELARSAETAVARLPSPRGHNQRVTTSDDLKMLLQRAERRAANAGRSATDPRDVLHVLAHDSRDLAGAQFSRGSPAANFGRERRDERWTDFLSLAPVSARNGQQRDDHALDLGGPLHRSGAENRTSDPLEGRTTAIEGRLRTQEKAYAELQRDIGMLSEQLRSLSTQLAQLAGESAKSRRDRDQLDAWIESRISSRVAGIANGDAALRGHLNALRQRLDVQERHTAELQRAADALAHQSASATARLSDVSHLGRAHDDALADIERRLLLGSSAQSSGKSRRSRSSRKSARSRLRQARRRALRFRLRQRRRERLRARDGWGGGGWRRRSRAARLGRSGSGDRAARSLHPAPVVAFRDPEAAQVEAFPCPIRESQPPLSETYRSMQPVDLDDEIAEPVEEDDDFEADGALGDRPKRFYLALGDDIERAPSIGPRTAERLATAGVATVQDLLLCNPSDVAARVQTRYVSAERLTAWKAQARLVCTVPWLRGTHAQLLVGAGYDTLDKLQRASTSDVCSGILRFAATRDGQSVLRSGPPPAPERVAKWMGHVTLAEPERAQLAA